MKKMSKVYKLSMAAIAASLVLVNCSSVEELVKEYADDESDYVSETFTGQFVDTYVKGLNYTCTGWLNGEQNVLTGSGVTNAKGEFTCNEGNVVEFSVGSYVLGSDHAFGDPIVTPYSLYAIGTLNPSSREAGLNIAQLLQTLDDHTVEGVLTIPDNFTALDNVDIKPDDTDFDALMADALPNVTALVSEEVAQAHLDESLGTVAPTPLPTTSLIDFVSDKSITFSGDGESMTATFASDGYYEENSDTYFCNGNWTLQSTNSILTTCTDEGVVATSEDETTFEFIGELKGGMTVVSSDMGETTITKIETAVNPDA